MSEYCECVSWCRSSTESNGKVLPISDHHPSCKNYKLEEFVRLTHDGDSCIVSKLEAESIISESDEHYETGIVMLTRDQFNNLPDFQGF